MLSVGQGARLPWGFQEARGPGPGFQESGGQVPGCVSVSIIYILPAVKNASSKLPFSGVFFACIYKYTFLQKKQLFLGFFSFYKLNKSLHFFDIHSSSWCDIFNLLSIYKHC
jgi:hypothetical protein